MINNYTNFFLSLAPDLALNKTASQNSTAWGGVASRAVDGNTNINWSGGSCTHTNEEANPWWRVDLGSPFPVAEVVIVNRDCMGTCRDRLKAFEIKIGKLLNFKIKGNVLHVCITLCGRKSIKFLQTAE